MLARIPLEPLRMSHVHDVCLRSYGARIDRDDIGFPVRNLKRIKFGTLSLKGLSKGKMRELNEDEAETLKKAAKLNG